MRLTDRQVEKLEEDAKLDEEYEMWKEKQKMTDELKTLKDLDYWLTNELFYEEGKRRKKFTEEKAMIEKEILKQEAIKWVNHDIKLFGKLQGRNINYKFITFFNITEEDLK